MSQHPNSMALGDNSTDKVVIVVFSNSSKHHCMALFKMHHFQLQDKLLYDLDTGLLHRFLLDFFHTMGNSEESPTGETQIGAIPRWTCQQAARQLWPHPPSESEAETPISLIPKTTTYQAA
eukprot:c31499_g1_i1 orf=105-467(+)